MPFKGEPKTCNKALPCVLIIARNGKRDLTGETKNDRPNVENVRGDWERRGYRSSP